QTNLWTLPPTTSSIMIESDAPHFSQDKGAMVAW
ncbi:hypothetical protein LSAT2_024661, partial [Lamellibrachia satsuma]